MKIKIFVLVFIIALFLSGCTVEVPDNVETTETHMEDWEFDLLCQTYDTDVELERIRSGNLYEHQKEMLEQTRDFKKYLEEKYPGHEFTIIKITPANMISGNNDSYEFWVDNGDEVFEAIVYEEDSTTFKDNYYATLLQPKYDEAIKAELACASQLQGRACCGGYLFGNRLNVDTDIV